MNDTTERAKTPAELLYEHRYGYRSDQYGWEWAACQGCSWPDGAQLSRGAGYEPHYKHQASLIEAAVREQIVTTLTEQAERLDKATFVPAGASQAAALRYAIRVARGEQR